MALRLKYLCILLVVLAIHLKSASSQTLFHIEDAQKLQKSVHSLEETNPDVVCSGYKDMLSNLILKFLERLRSHMSDGIPSLEIPPLDPLQVENTTFHAAKKYQYKVDGEVSDSLVEGLKTFNVTQISTSFLHLQANLTVAIPSFFITGKYELEGKLLSVIPFKGKGPYLLSPSDVLVSVTTQLHLVHSHLQITSMDFSLGMGKLLAKFEGLYGGGNIGSFLNSVINKFGLKVFNRIEPKFHDKIRTSLITVINEKLKEIPLFELIQMGAENHSCKRAISRSLIAKMNTTK